MEKYILVVSSVLIVVAVLSAVTAHPNSPAFAECKASENVSDADVKIMKDQSQPKTKAMKCFMTCVAEKHGKIVNNKLSSDGVRNWFKKMPNYNAQMEQSLNEVLQQCQNFEDPDRCENGAKIVECLMEGAKGKGLNLYGGKGNNQSS